MGIANLDALDEQILKLIADNARIPFLEVARACHVSGAAIHQRIEELRNIPEVVECHYTTGDYDMFIKIYARNNHHMLSIIHDKLQPLGLQRSETIISFHEAINRQMPIPEIKNKKGSTENMDVEVEEEE